MDFDRLRYLAAVARTGGIREAARSLDITPGAVSKAIARLETEAGVQLVAPQGRGIVLTDEGAWLARRADHLVGEYASLGADLAARRAREPGICLATYDVFAAWLPSLLARQYLPGVPLNVRERWPGEVEEAVATAVSDVGITSIPVPTDGVAHVEVATSPLRVVVCRGAFADVPLAELPFAVPWHPVSGATSMHGALDGWPADAPTRDVRFRVSSSEARMDLCRQGLAAIVLPEFVVAHHDARVPAAARFEAVRLPTALARMRRRVHVVHRIGAAEALRARGAAVEAAVRAWCAPPTDAARR